MMILRRIWLAVGQLAVKRGVAVRAHSEADYVQVADALQRAEDGLGQAEQRLKATLAELEGALLGANEIAAAAEFREARTRAVMDSVADGVVVFDTNGIIQSCNPSGEQIFNVLPGELLATQLGDLIPSLGLPSGVILVGTREVDGRHVGGALFPLEVTISPIALEEYPLWIAVVRDVTARREAATALAEARDAALQAVRVKSEFLATMSHEIRTPMNGVIGMTELLLDTELDPQQRTYTEAVQRSGEALLTLINDILDFSKIEAGKLHIEHIDVDVRQVIEDVAELLGEQAHRKGLQLVSVVDHTIGHGLLGDPSRLRQILLNLVGNAIKFTHTGEVRLRACVAMDTPSTLLVRFEVTDSGIGIEAEAQRRLFAPFVQADGSMARKYGGTGLGLAICRQLVERMGGEIGLDSTLGSGSTFWFTVAFDCASVANRVRSDRTGAVQPVVLVSADRGLRPMLNAPVRASERPEVLSGLTDPGRGGARAAPAALASLQGRAPVLPSGLARLLVAEDSTINQQVALGLLNKLGLSADVVANGKEALVALERTDYAAVLMDCQMPDMDGFEATAEIRKREGAGWHTPVIAMTANAMQGDRERCLAAGMDDYVSKPVRLEELTAALVRCLGSTDAPATRSRDDSGRPLAQLADADPFDRATLSALPAGLRSSLLLLFFEEVPMRFDRIRAALLEDAAAELQAAAHIFKGDAATVGAREVARLCRALEHKAQQHELASCEDLVQQLEAALAAARAAAPRAEPTRLAA